MAVVEPRSEATRANTAAGGAATGGFATLIESAAQEILAVTYWFDPNPQPAPYPVTVRFSGRRVNVEGRAQARDRFVQDETIEAVIPGSGPISITARVRDINPGEWSVTAQVLEPPRRGGGSRQREQATAPVTIAAQRAPIARRWRSWAPPAEPEMPTRTCLMPFARVPGVLPGAWGVLVGFGMVIALLIQGLVISRDHLAVGPAWLVSLIAIIVGAAGAKVWFAILHRDDRRLEGWAIQGFITAGAVAAAVTLVLLKVPVGVFLDATAPGMLFGLAVGRVGCFLAGCCGGPPTAARWGVWSSDQRVGARRVPTQLLESVLALGVGIAVLAGILMRGPARGAFFVAAVAAYTLVRQGVLHLRAEPRRTALGSPITASLAALALAAGIAFIVR